MELVQEVIERVSDAPYFWVSLILFLCGLGLPIPEEVTLIAAAWTTIEREGAAISNAYTMFLVALGSILAGDLATYFIGRIFGYRLVRLPYFRRVLSEQRLRKVDQFFEHYGDWAVFVARFFAGFRFACFFIAGITRLKVYMFVLMDLAAGLFSVGVTFWLVRKYGEQIEQAVLRIHNIQHLIIGVLALAVLSFVGWRYLRYRKKKIETAVDIPASGGTPPTQEGGPQRPKES